MKTLLADGYEGKAGIRVFVSPVVSPGDKKMGKFVITPEEGTNDLFPWC